MPFRVLLWLLKRRKVAGREREGSGKGAGDFYIGKVLVLKFFLGWNSTLVVRILRARGRIARGR